MSITYRREIDGLRALAVLPVIFFHAELDLFSGGFVGVDVFFVISGYLITSIVANELQAGTFSLPSFYERRLRRILPALFMMLAVSTVMAWASLLPQGMPDFSQGLAAVAVFVSNFFFWQQSGYFDSSSEIKPLLHTWSLAVEEQYYLLFPVWMTLVWGRGRSWVQAQMLCLAVLSLLVSQWLLLENAATSFFLLPSRGWELLIGALLALSLPPASDTCRAAILHQSASLAGLGLLILSMLTYDAATPFPGWHALLPTLAAALIIAFATPVTLVGRWLGHRWMAGIGLTSYSAYLWHQPLFAFARLQVPDGKLQPVHVFALCATTLALATLSWRFIEQPARRMPWSRRTVFTLAGAGSAVFLALGLIGATGLIPTRWALEHPDLSNQTAAQAPGVILSACPGFQPNAQLDLDVDCRQAGDGSLHVALWGDSHAEKLADHLPTLNGIRTTAVWHRGCAPIAGTPKDADPKQQEGTSPPAAYATEYLLNNPPDVLILAGRWSMYLFDGLCFTNRTPAATRALAAGTANEERRPTTADSARLTRQLARTIARFPASTHIIVIGQVPDLSLYHFYNVAATDFHASKSVIDDWHRGEDITLAALRRSGRVTILSPRGLLCSSGSGTCKTRLQGRLLYADENHVSMAGADLLWTHLERLIRALDQPVPPAATR